MPGFELPTSGPGDGLFPSDYIVEATNRSGAATGIGECVMFDMAQGATEVDNANPGSSDASGNNSAYNNYVDPAITAHSRHYAIGVVLEAIADNASGRVQVRGRCTALVATAVATGDGLVTAASGTMAEADGTSDQMVVAIAETADVAGFAPVLLDGVYGFGWDVTTA